MIGFSCNSGIADLCWDMRDQPVNVLNEASVDEFAEALIRATADSQVKGLIISSAHDEFIAGGDLHALHAIDTQGGLKQLTERIQQLFRRLETCGKPVVAAINGAALGGGLELCLACHCRLAAQEGHVKLGLPEVQVGLMPGAGGSQRLPRLIGYQAALPLIVEGKQIDQHQAVELGIVDRLVAAADLRDVARELLLTRKVLKDQPWDRKDFRLPGGSLRAPAAASFFSAANAMLREKTQGNYPAPLNAASAVYEGCRLDIDTGLRVETRYFLSTARTTQARNMTRFFFSRSATSQQQPPAEQTSPRFEKIGVLGAGMMGHGIAYAAAAAGVETVLLDVDRERAERGKQAVAKIVDKRLARGRIDQATAEHLLQRIHVTASYEQLSDCQLVIEAVFEDRQLKASVTKRAEAVLGQDATLASNTSTLPITGLAQATRRPTHFVGLHFFSPVERMPLVEIIRGKQTSDSTIAGALNFVHAIGKTPIVVNDSRGFFTSRVFASYVREGLLLLSEGVTPALIENAGRSAGMPLGPLALADEVSIDLVYAIDKQTRLDLGDSYLATPADEVTRKMIEAFRRPGRSAGRGFYDYPERGKKQLWPQLGEHFPAQTPQPAVTLLRERLLTIQALEAARCLDKGVVSSAGDADVGSVLGWGFAPHTGGVLSYIGFVGLQHFVATCERLCAHCGARFAPPPRLKTSGDPHTWG